jgi:putative phage-type endonuclease
MRSKNYKKEIFKTKEEWLKARGFGGSSASAILGKNPYMTELDLYRAIVSPKQTIRMNENESMLYGVQCEPLIRKLFILDFEEKYSVHTPRNNEMYRRIDKPYMTATLDGILTDKKTKEKGILEIKTHDIRNRKDEENWAQHIPDNYYIQVLHYLSVMNDFTFGVIVAKLRFFDYFDNDGKKLLKTETRYYYINRNDDQVKKDIEYLEKKETDFWENNIQKKVMPTLKFKF